MALRLQQKKWTAAELDELATRSWANQHWRGIARDMGRTLGSVRSQLFRLQLPRHDRTELVMVYDPKTGPLLAAANIRAAGYVKRECKVTKRLFWTPIHGGDRFSREGRKSRLYRDLSAGL